MAEKVELYGGQLDGTVINNAASEATLVKLLEAVTKSGGKSASGATTLSPEALKIQQTYNKAQQDGYFELGKFSRSLNSASGSMDILSDAISVAGKTVSTAFNIVAGTVSLAVAGIGLFGSAISTVASATNKLGEHIGNISELAMSTKTPTLQMFTDTIGKTIPLIGSLGRVIQTDIDQFRSLSTVGAMFGDDINDFRRAAVVSGLSIESFTDLIKSNSASLALIGGTASTGANTFVTLSNAIQKKYQPTFSKLGFTMAELSEYSMSYMTQMAMSGRAQQMTDEQLRESAEAYNLELDKMSRATGLQRSEIDKANQAAARDARMRTAMFKMDEDRKTEFNAKMEQLNKVGASDWANGLKDMLASGGVAMTETSQQTVLAASKAGYDLQAIMRDVGNNVPGSVDKMNEALEASAKVAANMSDEERRLAGIGMNQSKQNMYSTLSQLTGLTNTSKSLTDATKEQAEIIEKGKTATAGFDKTLQNARDMIMTVFMPLFDKLNPVINSFMASFKEGTPLFDALAEKVNSVATFLAGFISQLSEDPRGAIQGLIAKFIAEVPNIVNSIKEVLLSPTVMTAVGDAFRALVPILKDIGIGLWEMTKEAFSGMLKGIADTFSTSDLLSAAVTGISLLFGATAAKAALASALDTLFTEGGSKKRPTGGPDIGIDEDGGKGGKGGKLGKFAKAGGGLLGAVAGAGLSYAGSELKESGHEKMGAAANVAGSALSGAAMGAMFGPIGAAIGGAIGAGVGLYGEYTESKEKAKSGISVAPIPGASIPANAAKPSETVSTEESLRKQLADAEKKHAELKKTLFDENDKMKPASPETNKAFEDSAVQMALLTEQLYAIKAGVKDGIVKDDIDKQKVNIQQLHDQLVDKQGRISDDPELNKKYAEAKSKLSSMEFERDSKKQGIPENKTPVGDSVKVSTTPPVVTTPKPADIVTPSTNVPVPNASATTDVTKTQEKTITEQHGELVQTIKTGNETSAKVETQLATSIKVNNDMVNKLDTMNSLIKQLILVQTGGVDATKYVADAVKRSGNNV